MSERALREAIKLHLAGVSRSLRCVSDAAVLVFPRDRLRAIETVTIKFGAETPIRLRGKSELWLKAVQELRLTPHSKHSPAPKPISMVGYSYQVSTGNQGSLELVAYHWKESASVKNSRTGPHLHICSTISSPLAVEGFEHFHKRHIPTGVVPFSSVVRFLIEELGVEPIRSNWDEILANVLD